MFQMFLLEGMKRLWGVNTIFTLLSYSWKSGLVERTRQSTGRDVLSEFRQQKRLLLYLHLQDEKSQRLTQDFYNVSSM